VGDAHHVEGDAGRANRRHDAGLGLVGRGAVEHQHLAHQVLAQHEAGHRHLDVEPGAMAPAAVNANCGARPAM
jgi:hypothetical protein